MVGGYGGRVRQRAERKAKFSLIFSKLSHSFPICPRVGDPLLFENGYFDALMFMVYLDFHPVSPFFTHVLLISTTSTPF